MRIFISGVTGYVGRNLARYLLNNHDVVGLSRDLSKSQPLEEIGVSIFHGDLLSSNLVEGLIGCDVLIHAAADTCHRNTSATQYETNVIGTDALINAAKTAGVRKVIYISSESVILSGKPIQCATESTPPPEKAVGNYSETKRYAEEIVLRAREDFFEVVALRPRFVWGRDDTTAMPQIIDAIRAKKFAWISGGQYKTSSTHIGNLCAAVESAIYHGISGEIYFISDGDDKTFKEIISALVAAHGENVPSSSVPRFALLAIAKLDEIKRRVFSSKSPLAITFQEYSTSAVEITLDISKARRELGYKPVVSFEEGLKEIQDFYIS